MLCFRKKYTFLIMDFEFIRWHNQKMVLVSGAMANYQKTANIIKLQGHPLVLNYEANFIKFNLKHRDGFIKYISKALRHKPHLLESFLYELQKSIAVPAQSSNLNSEYIFNYFNKLGKQPIIVLWNGANDSEILYRLKISVPIILNITTYNNYGDNQYFLKLINWEKDEILFNHKIANIKKNGRQLSLEETHSSICNIKHQIMTYVHDPAVDVLYTKCIFDYILKLEGYDNILTKAISL